MKIKKYLNIKEALFKTFLFIVFLVLNGLSQIQEMVSSGFDGNQIIDAIIPIILLIIIFGVNLKK